MTIPRDRAPYSAIVDRPPLPPLPGGSRIVVWTIVNVEVWDSMECNDIPMMVVRTTRRRKASATSHSEH